MTMDVFTQHEIATIAEYWLRGIEAGLRSADEAKAWAFRAIEVYAEPPLDIIDIAMASHRTELITVLGSVGGDRDSKQVALWLLNDVRNIARPDHSNTDQVIVAAMHVLRATSFDEDLYQTFDGIHDSISLAFSGTYGDVEDCYRELDEVLNQFHEQFPETI